MKTIYLLKLLLPLIFLPIAPSVVQMELARHGLVNYSTGILFTIALQVAFTAGIFGWVAYTTQRRAAKKAFLRMSCISKKVFYNNRWMTVESYLAEYHNIVVSHGMTPEESTAWIQESEEWLRGHAVESEARQECLTH